MTEILGIDITQADLQRWLAEARDFLLPRLAESLVQVLLVVAVWFAARRLLRWVQRRITSRTKTEFDDVLLSMVSRVLLLSVAFWGAWRLATIWQLPGFGRFVVAVWIVSLSLPLSRLITDMLRMLERRVIAQTATKLDDTALPWINRIAQGVVIGTAAMIALDHLGIDITPLLAGATVTGFAVSFAAKDTLANIIAGILLVVDRPFVVGDRIELWNAPPGQASWGDVVEIGLRATKIRTPDNIDIIIPNSVITQRDIINWTASGDSIRLRIPVGIAYDADVDLAKRLILQVAAECEHVQKQPEPVVILRDFGASSVDLELRVWVHDARQRRAAADWITERVKQVFDANGVEIPYPKRDLYIRHVAATATRAGTTAAADGGLSGTGSGGAGNRASGRPGVSPGKEARMADGRVKQSTALPLQEVAAGSATRMQVLLGPDDGAPNFAMRRFVMGEGGGMPRHTNAVEHEQYVLRGRARITIGEQEHEVAAGDVVYIPAGAPHSYEVLEAPFEFLCMVPNRPDRIEIVDPD